MKVLFILFIIFFNVNLLFAVEDIIYSVNNKDLEKVKYKIELMKMILDNTNIDYNLYYFQNNIKNPEISKSLKNGKITIATLGASIEKEKNLIPIRIPIFKGLLGYRIFLINKDDQPKFNKIKTLNDLRKLTGAQGVGWQDLEILKDAGLKQISLPYETITKMLNIGNRIDYFARAIYEAFGETQSLKTEYPNIVVEKNILLVYPFALYFYVSPKYPELAKKIEKSFNELVNSGKFDNFFYNHTYIKKAILNSNINNRLKFEIPNNYLSKETKKLPAKYWFDINKIIK